MPSPWRIGSGPSRNESRRGGRTGDPTYVAARQSAGEKLETMGAHDWHEPTLLTRVYFVLDREVCQIKVGYTRRSVAARVRELERKRGRKLELLGTLTGGYDLERAMHGRFREYRREGHDWYGSEIIADVAALLES